MLPKYLTEDKYKGRIRVVEPVECAVCKQHTHNLNVLWHAFICSDECEEEFNRQYELEYERQRDPLDQDRTVPAKHVGD